MDIKSIFQIESLLDQIAITYRTVLLPDGVIFFCDNEGQTFNILITRTKAKIWTFVSSNMPNEQRGLKISFKVIRFKMEMSVTNDDDRDLVFSLEQESDNDFSDVVELEMLIEAFHAMLKWIKARLYKSKS